MPSFAGVFFFLTSGSGFRVLNWALESLNMWFYKGSLSGATVLHGLQGFACVTPNLLSPQAPRPNSLNPNTPHSLNPKPYNPNPRSTSEQEARFLSNTILPFCSGLPLIKAVKIWMLGCELKVIFGFGSWASEA